MIDLWRWHQFIGISTTVIVFCVFMRYYGKLNLIALCYFLLSALFIFMYPVQRFSNQLPFDSTSGQAFAILLVIAIFVIPLTRDGISLTLDLLELTFLINSIVVICVGYGMFHSRSSDAATIAAILPSVFFRKKHLWNKTREYMWASGIVHGTAILLMHGSTSYFVIAAAVLCYAILNIRQSWRVIAVLATAFSVLAVGYAREGIDFLNSSGRFEHWSMFMGWWQDNANPLFGTGIGSFEWLGPMIQQMNKEKAMFLFMHNEYLQVLFEGGIVGLTLALLVWLIGFWRARKETWLVLSYASLSMLMMTQFPLRFFVSALFTALILKSSDHVKNT